MFAKDFTQESCVQSQFDRSGNDIQITVSPCLTYFLACPIKDISVVSDYYLLPDLPTYYVAKSSA